IRRHVADFVVQDEIIALEQVARVNARGFQQDDPAGGERVFLHGGSAEQPRALQRQDEDEQFDFHGRSFPRIVLYSVNFLKSGSLRRLLKPASLTASALSEGCSSMACFRSASALVLSPFPAYA